VEASGVSWGSAAHDRADHFCEPVWPEVVKPATAEVADDVGVVALGTSEAELDGAPGDTAGPDVDGLAPGLVQAPMIATTTNGPASIAPMRRTSAVWLRECINWFPPKCPNEAGLPQYDVKDDVALWEPQPR
jgi:hypothetical protein